MTSHPPRLDLNPSSADRWTACTASPGFIMENHDKIPKSTDTVYNREGTTAHEVAASLLQNRPLWSLGEPDASPFPVDEQMWLHGWNYHEYVLALREPGSKLLVEQKLPLWYMPARNCIVDAAVINKDNLHIIDYKYGEGIVVSPVRSLQATIYAQTIGSGMLPFPPDDFPVFVHIYQPRGRAGESGPGHVWETTWGEIAEIAAGINMAASLIQVTKINAPMSEELGIKFAPSDKACQWCPAKGFCTARQQSLSEGFEIIETSQQTMVLSSLTIEQRALIQRHGAAMKSWIEDVQEYNLQQANAGEKLPGFKLVMSRGGNRYWSDPKKAAALLARDTILKHDEVVEEKTISPSAVEKLIGKGKFTTELSALIQKPSGSAVLAPEEDKREAIAGVQDIFEIIPPDVQIDQ